MRTFLPIGQQHGFGVIVRGDRLKSLNILRRGITCTATFDLDENDFEEVTAFDDSVRDSMITTDGNKINDAGALSAVRPREGNDLPALGWLILPLVFSRRSPS